MSSWIKRFLSEWWLAHLFVDLFVADLLLMAVIAAFNGLFEMVWWCLGLAGALSAILAVKAIFTVTSDWRTYKASYRKFLAISFQFEKGLNFYPFDGPHVEELTALHELAENLIADHEEWKRGEYSLEVWEMRHRLQELTDKLEDDLKMMERFHKRQHVVG